MREFLLHRLIGNFVACFVGFTIIASSVKMNGDAGVFDGNLPILIGVFLSCYWMIRIHAYQEHLRILRNEHIDNVERVISRSLYILMYSSWVHFSASGLTLNGLYQMIGCSLFITSLFWLCFDFILNVDLGREPFYVSKWYKESRLDKVFMRDPRLWLMAKVATFAAATAFYIHSLI